MVLMPKIRKKKVAKPGYSIALVVHTAKQKLFNATLTINENQ